MSITTTPNLHLPQWTADEQPSFLAEINGAWSSIDTGYGQTKTDAATAITASNNAVSIANGAKQQSQANAGQITQLQNNLTQLRNEFSQAARLIHQSVPVTISQSFSTLINNATCEIVHNNYNCVMTLRIFLKSNATFNIPENEQIIASVNLPFIYNELKMSTDIAVVNDNLKFNEKMIADTVFVTINNGNIKMSLSQLFSPITTTTPPTIDIRGSFPIFVSNGSRENMPDNCLFLLAQ